MSNHNERIKEEEIDGKKKKRRVQTLFCRSRQKKKTFQML